MKIAFYGSSLLSSYWNGAATYYRGILRALAGHGHDITFYEPDAHDRGRHRDFAPPSWCRVVVYPATPDGLKSAAEAAEGADVVVKASGVGYADDALLAAVMAAARPEAVRIWWDVDAPATLAEIEPLPDHPIRAHLPDLDLVLTYGGGPPVVAAYGALGAVRCLPIYNGLDTTTHHPVPPDPAYTADLGFLGNRLPDRESRVERFFIDAAKALPGKRFLLGGAGWDDKPCPASIRKLGHVPSTAHNAFNVTPLAVLNVNRDSMAAVGFSPPTRIFEAAGAGACLLSDDWPGIDRFFAPGREILLVRDTRDVVEALEALDAARSREIGRAALTRALADHTYDRRAARVDAALTAARERKSAARAACATIRRRTLPLASGDGAV